MAMGGGTFTAYNKTLPGTYVNFEAAEQPRQLGERGTAIMPLVLPWGADNQIIEMAASDFEYESLAVFGYPHTAGELLLVREALKGARMLKVYKVNQGGTAATKLIGGATVTAVCTGVRGNDIRIGIAADPDNETHFVVTTYIDGAAVDVQTATATGDGLQPNAWVTFNVASGLAEAAPEALSGGTNGTATGASYLAFTEVAENTDFNTLGYPGNDSPTKAVLAEFVKRLIDDGRYVQGVFYRYAGDHIGIINVKNGVKLADGTALVDGASVAWVTGATAGANVNQSLTNKAYPGAVDVDTRYTKRQAEQAIAEGEFVFYADRGAARVLRDINSFATEQPKASKDWASNRVVRTMHGVATEAVNIYNDNYLGDASNSASQRGLYQADVVKVLTAYQEIEAIDAFDAATAAVVSPGVAKNETLLQLNIQPIDSMEILYMLVRVS